MEKHEAEREYYDTIYFVSDKEIGDWMGKVYRVEGGPWRLSYRFRYYLDHKVFHDSEDVKHWYGVIAPDDSDKSLLALNEAVRRLLPQLEQTYGNKADIVSLKRWNDDIGFIVDLGQYPWANVREYTPEQFEAAYGKH